MKKIVVCADSFKGTLSSERVCEIIASSAKSVFMYAEINCLPVADGGEGTLDVFKKLDDFEVVEGLFTDLNGKKTLSKYLFDKNTQTAVIETAETSGLTLSESKNPLITTTVGLGEQMKAALKKGAKKIVVGLGGSGTNDGGAGMLFALGAKFFDKNGNEFLPTGGNLSKVKKVDLSRLDERLEKTEIVAMCDIVNPPFGENGATYIYGRQKGAREEDLPVLERGVKNLTELLSKEKNEDFSLLSGGGAAGGLGLSLKAALGAELRRGIEVAIDLIGLEKALLGADLLVTGEGKLDEQSFMGKVVDGVANVAKKRSVPVVAICGAVDVFDEDILRENGIIAAFPTVNKAECFEKAKDKSAENLERTAIGVFSLIKAFEK